MQRNKPEKIDVLKHYDEVSKDFARQRFSENEEQSIPDYEWELVRSQITKKDKILDDCCGPCGFLIPLQKEDYDIIGIDISKKMLEEAKKRMPEANCIHGDALDLPFKNETFDIVINMGNSLGVIPHKKNRQQALNEACRVLKPKGKLLLVVINRDSKKHKTFWDEQRKLYMIGLSDSSFDFGDIIYDWNGSKGFNHIYSINEIKNEIMKAGFSTIHEIDSPEDRIVLICIK